MKCSLSIKVRWNLLFDGAVIGTRQEEASSAPKQEVTKEEGAVIVLWVCSICDNASMQIKCQLKESEGEKLSERGLQIT